MGTAPISEESDFENDELSGLDAKNGADHSEAPQPRNEPEAPSVPMSANDGRRAPEPPISAAMTAMRTAEMEAARAEAAEAEAAVREAEAEAAHRAAEVAASLFCFTFVNT